MKRLVLLSIILLVALAGPLATQPWANDAHHPEKATSTNKPPAKQKKPATKPKKPKQGELQLRPDVRKG